MHGLTLHVEHEVVHGSGCVTLKAVHREAAIQGFSSAIFFVFFDFLVWNFAKVYQYMKIITAFHDHLINDRRYINFNSIIACTKEK